MATQKRDDSVRCIRPDPCLDDSGAFNINQCNYCQKTAKETQLKRCGACFSVSYCSAEHQKMQWSKHKEFCKVLRKVEKILPEANIENWRFYRNQMLQLCILEMKRELNMNEKMLINYPGRCEICRSKYSVIICPKCFSTNYCSEEHKELDSKYHSDKLCDTLKFMMNTNLYSKKKPCLKYCLRKGTLTLTENMEEFIDKNLEFQRVGPDLRKYHISLLSTLVSHSLSLLCCLKWLDYKINDTLTVHIVGSEATETELLTQWEIIPHIHRNIKKFNIVCVGPYAVLPPSNDLCKYCRKIINIQVSNQFYHEFVENSDKYQKPDVVCAFNCGLSAYPEWVPTIPFLIQDAPFILSAYAEYEFDQDIKLIYGVKPDVNVLKRRNPFSGLLVVQRAEHDEFLYMNKYLAVFSKPSKN